MYGNNSLLSRFAVISACCIAVWKDKILGAGGYGQPQAVSRKKGIGNLGGTNDSLINAPWLHVGRLFKTIPVFHV